MTRNRPRPVGGRRRLPGIPGAVPATIPGLQLWLRGSRIGVPHLSSIAVCPDRSGFDRDGTQASAGAQPSRFNNLIRFEEDQYLNVGTLGNVGTLAQRGVTVWAVLATVGLSTPRAMFGTFHPDTESHSSLYVLVDEVAGQVTNGGGVEFAIAGGADGVLSGGLTYNSGIADGFAHSLAVQFLPSAAEVRVQLDGNDETVTYGSQQSPTMSDFDLDLYVGNYNEQGSPSFGWFDGGILDLCLYAGHHLTPPELARLNEYGERLIRDET